MGDILLTMCDMEYGLKDIAFYVAHRTVFYNLPLVRDKSLWVSAFVKLVYSGDILIFTQWLQNSVKTYETTSGPFYWRKLIQVYSNFLWISVAVWWTWATFLTEIGY